ncbi:immunoglobulin-like domain-containing protein [Listeria innocua]|uniref:immunoglobulin-like domain-containing protein n=1 Tax=Listeria innocua TaxID=1642 RepID=UPI001625E606|nr:immunoglobulin-like domain-containing protein [Listeria innocua]MBC1925567.1 DUF5011 domain-containing protein [Listeria innocua]
MHIQLKTSNSPIFTEEIYAYPTFITLSKQMKEGENVAFSICDEGETLYTTSEIGFVKIGNDDSGNSVHTYLQDTFQKILKVNRWRFKFFWTTRPLIKKLAKRLAEEMKQSRTVQPVLPQDLKPAQLVNETGGISPSEVPPIPPTREVSPVIEVKRQVKQFRFLPLLLTSMISSMVSICACLLLFSIWQMRTVPQIQGVTPLTVSVGENIDLMKGVSTNSNPSSISVSGSVDTSQAGEYFVTYQVGQTTVLRPIKVVNDSPRLKGIKNSVLTKGETVDIYEGISAEDKEDGQLTSAIQVVGFVDTNKVGTYYLTYSVCDSGHQTDQKTRTIIVNEIGKN